MRDCLAPANQLPLQAGRAVCLTLYYPGWIPLSAHPPSSPSARTLWRGVPSGAPNPDASTSCEALDGSRDKVALPR